MKALIVGRHDAEYGDEIEVMGNENITFPARSEDIDLAYLYNRAKELGADAIIFQATPPQLTSRLAYESRLNGDSGQEIQVWGVVNTPRPDLRQEPTVEEFEFDSIHDQTMARVAIQKANPRAKIEEVRPGRIRMTVDAPMPFKFSHLERIL